jgi:hypothetical protein
VTDTELVYASTFLAVTARWEAFLEIALFESVCGQIPKERLRVRHIECSSRAQFRRILLHPNQDYVSLSPPKKAKELYGLYLRESGPLSAISESNQTYIQQAMWIRNAIAHSSDFAVTTFRSRVPGVSSLPPIKRHPGPFLRHEFRASPSQRRLDLYLTAFRSAAAEFALDW